MDTNTNMDTNTKSTGKYWVYFLISTVAMIAMMIIIPEWFWVLLPMVCTYFVMAMDWM